MDSLYAGRTQTRNEVNRRKKYFDKFENVIGSNHQDLLALTKICLSNYPTLRPSCQNVVTRLKDLKTEGEKIKGAIVLQKTDISRTLLTREMAMKEKEIKDGEVSINYHFLSMCQ